MAPSPDTQNVGTENQLKSLFPEPYCRETVLLLGKIFPRYNDRYITYYSTYSFDNGCNKSHEGLIRRPILLGGRDLQ